MWTQFFWFTFEDVNKNCHCSKIKNRKKKFYKEFTLCSLECFFFLALEKHQKMKGNFELPRILHYFWFWIREYGFNITPFIWQKMCFHLHDFLCWRTIFEKQKLCFDIGGPRTPKMCCSTNPSINQTWGKKSKKWKDWIVQKVKGLNFYWPLSGTAWDILSKIYGFKNHHLPKQNHYLPKQKVLVRGHGDGRQKKSERIKFWSSNQKAQKLKKSKWRHMNFVYDLRKVFWFKCVWFEESVTFQGRQIKIKIKETPLVGPTNL